MCKADGQWKVAIWRRELRPDALWHLAGWEVGGRFKREGTQVYPGLIHKDIWQKPIQSCKAIILQLKTETFTFFFFVNFAPWEFSSLKKLERPLTPAETNIITKHLISNFLIYLSFPKKSIYSSHKSLFSLHPSTELGTEACSFNHLASHTFVVSCI